MCAVSELFDRLVDKNLLVRRMYVVANHVLSEADAPKKNDGAVQLDLFTDYAAEEEKQKACLLYTSMGVVYPQYAEKNILIDYGVIEEAE